MASEARVAEVAKVVGGCHSMAVYGVRPPDVCDGWDGVFLVMVRLAR